MGMNGSTGTPLAEPMRMRNPVRLGLVSVTLAFAALVSFPPQARGAGALDLSAFNLFTVEQDVEIGRESAAEAEKQLTLLGDASVDRYLNQIVARLAAATPGADYPYQIKGVNDAAINAFALPGGPMYANRGLIVASRSEAELAGVIAHEMAHVALRHGTHQASTAYIAEAGIGILGGLLGDSAGSSSQMLAAVGGLGLNAAFLKFGRDDEHEADSLGAEIMAASGYDPNAMADFFALLRAEGQRDPSALQVFFSGHPPSAERETRIRALAKTLPRARQSEVGGFSNIVARLNRMPATSAKALTPQTQARSSVAATGTPVAVRSAAPSAKFATYAHQSGDFNVVHPSNWKVYAARNGYATSIAPAGGIVKTKKGAQAMVYGVVINRYEPFEGEASRRGRRKSIRLANASDDLVKQVLRANPYLSGPAASPKKEKIDGRSARSVTLAGRSPVTGDDERVVVFTRSLPDNQVIYGLLVAPEREYAVALPVFERMMRTLEMKNGTPASRRGG
jgi:Zn-dependent protease with chaperone function